MPEQHLIVQNCEITGKVNSSITRATENFENSVIILFEIAILIVVIIRQLNLRMRVRIAAK